MATLLGGVTSASGQDPILFSLNAANDFYLATSVLPEGISVSKSCTWQQIAILGRCSPVFAYSNSSPISMSVKLKLFAKTDATSEVVQPIESLLSLEVPMSPGILPPPPLLVTCAGFTVFNNWPCVVERCDPSWGKSWAPDGSPMFADVTLNLLGYETGPVASAQYLTAEELTQLAF